PRQARVGFDRGSELGGAFVRILGEFQQPNRTLGQGGKLGAGQEVLEVLSSGGGRHVETPGFVRGGCRNRGSSEGDGMGKRRSKPAPSQIRHSPRSKNPAP